MENKCYNIYILCCMICYKYAYFLNVVSVMQEEPDRQYPVAVTGTDYKAELKLALLFSFLLTLSKDARATGLCWDGLPEIQAPFLLRGRNCKMNACM